MIDLVKIFQLLLLVTFFGEYQSLLDMDGLFNYGPPPEALNRVNPKNQKYHFIVVGAGSAGSVLANRLSENKHWNILLLEAGETQSYMQEIPIFAGYFSLFPRFNWGYKVEPQKNACLSMMNRQCSWPRGKSLGGTSTINYMIHARGVKADYDTWAAMGNEGWSYDEVLHYFKKSERFDVPG
jgi:choline dehydrogenase-like flavoprotein